jgi:4-nitrophenyl phosphatase
MPMKHFSQIIFDMDGVIYRGNTPIPGAAKALEKIRNSGYKISFITNNATRSRKQLQKHMKKMGIKTSIEEIMTSAYAAAFYIKSLNPKPQKVYVLGEKGLMDELKDAGFCALQLPAPIDKGNAVLVSGLDRKVTYAKLAAALKALDNGARWVACNLDPTLPIEHGFLPGSGSIAASLAYAKGKISKNADLHDALFSNIKLQEPDFVAGKPNDYMIKLICKGKKIKRKEILFVGDRLDMDIAFANHAKMSSLLVLSGVTGKDEAKKARGIKKPKAMLDSIAELPDWLGI